MAVGLTLGLTSTRGYGCRPYPGPYRHRRLWLSALPWALPAPEAVAKPGRIINRPATGHHFTVSAPVPLEDTVIVPYSLHITNAFVQAAIFQPCAITFNYKSPPSAAGDRVGFELISANDGEPPRWVRPQGVPGKRPRVSLLRHRVQPILPILLMLLAQWWSCQHNYRCLF